MGMVGGASGIVVPSPETIAFFHPQFALAAACGVPVRPNHRPLSATFSTTATGQVKSASFDEQIGAYSVFSRAKVTIDPTNAFLGNVLKTLSDTAQAMTSGITLTFEVRGRNGDYTPIPEDIPLQTAEDVFNGSAGMWAMDAPENVKCQFTVAGNVPDAPFTVWLIVGFLVLGEGGSRYMCMTRDEARDHLARIPRAMSMLAAALGAPPPREGA